MFLIIDIDECALGGHTCHAGQDCENILGSYHCVVRCGNGFRRTADGFSCQGMDWSLVVSFHKLIMLTFIGVKVTF